MEPEIDMREAAFQADLEALRVAYMLKLPDYRAAVVTAWRGCTDDAGENPWRELRRSAHRLSGTAPCYGLDAVGAAARELDRLLSGRDPCRERDVARPQVERLLDELNAAMQVA